MPSPPKPVQRQASVKIRDGSITLDIGQLINDNSNQEDDGGESVPSSAKKGEGEDIAS